MNAPYGVVEPEAPEAPDWIISDSCRSGEFWHSVMMRSTSILLKPGSWAVTALDAPPEAPEASEEPAVEVEPVVSVLALPELPASAVVDEVSEPDAVPLPLSAVVAEVSEPEAVSDVLLESAVVEEVSEPEAVPPVLPASADVEDVPDAAVPDVSVEPEAPPADEAWFDIDMPEPV